MPGLAGRELGQERGPGNAWWAAMGRVRRMGGAPPQCPPIGRSAPACRVRAASAASRTGADGWTASAAARMANLAAPQTSRKKSNDDLLKKGVRQDFFWGIAATWRRCDGGHGTRRTMVVGQRGHRSMVARGLSHRRVALILVGWPRLRPRSQLPPAFEQLALGLTLPR